MAQFDVHHNPVGAMIDMVPYVLQIQAGHLDHFPTRIVIPLARKGPLMMPTRTLNPVLTVRGEDLVVVTEQVTSLPANVLGAPVASLAEHRLTIISALDFLFTGI